MRYSYIPESEIGHARAIAVAEREPVPAPELTSRDSAPDDALVPLGARRVIKLAQSYGWTVRVTHARGYLASRSGRTVKLTDTVAVRINNSLVTRWAHVIYARPVGGSWTADTVLLSGGPAGVFPYAGIEDVSQFLQCSTTMPDDWYAAIVARVSRQQARARTVSKKVKESGG